MPKECVVITPYDSNIKYKYSLKRLFYSNKLKNSLKYPYNYCIFPNTISSSQTPLKCFILLKEVIYPGTSIDTHIGGFKYIDSKGFFNHRILCVPNSNIKINDITDVPHFTLEEIKLFMLQYYHYNKSGKIKFKGFFDKKEANDIYKNSFIRYNIKNMASCVDKRQVFGGLFKKIYKSSNNINGGRSQSAQLRSKNRFKR